MARIIGFVAGVATGLSVVYWTDAQFRKNTRAIVTSLRSSRDVVLNKPHLTRPYTDPINLSERSVGDTVTDIWNREIIRGVQYIYSLAKSNNS